MKKSKKAISISIMMFFLISFVLPINNVLAQTTTDDLLQDIDVTGIVVKGGSGDFIGTMSILSFAPAKNPREILVTGVLNGSVNEIPVDNVVFTAPATLTEGSSITTLQLGTGGSCQILDLDIGPIFIDLLGLQIDIAPIQIVITAVTGAGNLLGNLLCAVVGLLDPPQSPLQSALLALLNTINQILSNLLTGLLP
jgi:hypothetical protein